MRSALVALGACGLFVLIAVQVARHQVLFFDRPLLLFLHAHASSQLDRLMLALSAAGSALVLVPFDLVVLWWLAGSGQRWRAAYWALATAGAGVIDAGTKQLFQRARPDLWPSISPETSFSFPSGHAMHTMAVCLALAVLGGKMRGKAWLAWLGALYVLAVGLSRSYLGVHFPSDVLAAWCAAACWVIGLAGLMGRKVGGAYTG